MAAPAQTSTRDFSGHFGVFDPPEIYVECRAFAGSLATLFLWVRDKKVDLLEVPLAPICEAYFRYVLDDAGSDPERSSVALAALSHLLERKAWALLPVPDSEEPEDDDLFSQIEPYVYAFGPAIERLGELRHERDMLFFRTACDSPYEVPFDTAEVSSNDLARALERLISRAKPDPVGHLSKPRRSLSDQMVVVLKALRNEFTTLEDLVSVEFTRSEVVWWFLALLELIRLGQALVRMSDESVMFARGSAS